MKDSDIVLVYFITAGSVTAVLLFITFVMSVCCCCRQHALKRKMFQSLSIFPKPREDVSTRSADFTSRSADCASVRSEDYASLSECFSATRSESTLSERERAAEMFTEYTEDLNVFGESLNSPDRLHSASKRSSRKGQRGNR